MLMARRASLFQREIRVALSSAATELLIDNAQVLSEGQVEEGRFFGSTMMSLDLRRLDSLVSDQLSAETTTRFGKLAATDEQLKAHSRRVAVSEAERLSGTSLREPQLDINVHSEGPTLHIDIDIEAELGVHLLGKPAKRRHGTIRNNRNSAHPQRKARQG